MNRREFLVTTAAVAAAATLPDLQEEPLRGDYLAEPLPAYAPDVEWRMPIISRVQYHSDTVLPVSGIPAKFSHYREEHRANDVWRCTCYFKDEQYGLEVNVTDLDRANVGPSWDLDAEARERVRTMVDRMMLHHHIHA